MIMQQPTSGPVPVSKLVPFTGIDRGFNAAVVHIANRLNPRGWDLGYAYAVPNTLEGLKREYARHGRLIVSSENSDHTIFGDPEVNYAFRAWHDWHHLHYGYEFTPQGEANVAFCQTTDLITLYGQEKARLWRKLIDIEVNGQVRYHEYHGCFPIYQRDFAEAQLAGKSMSYVFH